MILELKIKREKEEEERKKKEEEKKNRFRILKKGENLLGVEKNEIKSFILNCILFIFLFFLLNGKSLEFKR